MGLAEFITIAFNFAGFLKDYPLVVSLIVLFCQMTRSLQFDKTAGFFNIATSKLKKSKSFDPETLYTKRPVIEFTPICFVQKQDNVDAFVKSIQSFIDETIMTRVHLITYNFVPLTNIDVYFMRAIEQLLDNCIYDNNGLLITFIFQNNVDKNSLIFELQELIKNKVTDEISQKRIQTNTIIIKYDERGQFNKSVK